MDYRLRLDLHLDAFGMCEGGGYTIYTPDGRRTAAGVVVAFDQGIIEVSNAVAQLREFAESDPNFPGQLRLW